MKDDQVPADVLLLAARLFAGDVVVLIDFDSPGGFELAVALGGDADRLRQMPFAVLGVVKEDLKRLLSRAGSCLAARVDDPRPAGAALAMIVDERPRLGWLIHDAMFEGASA